ncbi:hypothetical protein NDU88_001794 [Pleurodeles waltl]|uniref:Uncharacterized protein n=1 Tax=Pleurodeles waltl TaxID=8319 RepID=A0AAV7U7V3_PLEWA|nr:hypothetical protein NDU88_001794 [Pleurodeles waltl]
MQPGTYGKLFLSCSRPRDVWGPLRTYQAGARKAPDRRQTALTWVEVGEMGAYKETAKGVHWELGGAISEKLIIVTERYDKLCYVS